MLSAVPGADLPTVSRICTTKGVPGTPGGGGGDRPDTGGGWSQGRNEAIAGCPSAAGW